MNHRFLQSRAAATGMVLTAMLSFQLGATIAKGLFPLISIRAVVMLRMSLAALILCALHRPWRHELSRTEQMAIFAYGIVLSAMNVLFYYAIARVPLGILYGLGAGVCWGLYIILGRHGGSTIPGGIVTAWGMVIGSCVVIPLSLIHAGHSIWTPSIFGLAALIAILSSALPYLREHLTMPQWAAIGCVITASCGSTATTTQQVIQA